MKFNIGRLRDLANVTRILDIGLRSLTFLENFNSEKVTITLKPLEEKIIPHSLKVSPSYYIIVRKQNVGEVIDGSTWDASKISLKNTSSNNITLTILIME